jgi:hypothetical protein
VSGVSRSDDKIAIISADRDAFRPAGRRSAARQAGKRRASPVLDVEDERPGAAPRARRARKVRRDRVRRIAPVVLVSARMCAVHILGVCSPPWQVTLVSSNRDCGSVTDDLTEPERASALELVTTAPPTTLSAVGDNAHEGN